MRGETGHVRGKGAKANSAALECVIFRFGVSGLNCEGSAQNVSTDVHCVVSGETEHVKGKGQGQTVQYWSVSFFVSGFQACIVKAVLKVSLQRFIVL